MKTTKRLGALALALVMALSALTGCGGNASGSSSSSAGGDASGSSAQAEPMDLTQITDPYLAVSGLAGDEVVAKVGEYEITAADYLYWLNRVIDNYLSQFNGQVTTLPWDTEMGDSLTFGQYMLDQAMDVTVFYAVTRQMAQADGLTPDPSVASDTDQYYADLVFQAGGDETKVTYTLWANMLTRDQFTRLNEDSDLYDQLQELRFGESSGNYPTDAEVNAYLDETGQYRAKHILLATIDLDTREPLDEETIAQKKATADDLLAQLRAAEDPISLFDTLMQENSEDGGLAANPNGYIFNAQDSLVGGFREATLALDVGDISDVVETDYGYHIMLRLPIDPADYRDEVITDGMQAKADQWLEELGVEKTADFDKLDPADIWEKLTALRTAIRQEVDAVQSREDASNGGQS